MESGVRFACPSCNQALLAQQQAAETQGNCPFCGVKFSVPALGAPLPPGAVAEPAAATGALPEPGGKEWGTAESRELWVGFLIGAGITLGLLLVLFPFKGTYVADLFLDRGWVPYVLVLFLGWAAGILILKCRRQRRTASAQSCSAAAGTRAKSSSELPLLAGPPMVLSR